MNNAKGLAAGLLLLTGGALGLVYLALLVALLLASVPGLEVFAVVCGSLALFAWFLGTGLLSGASRPFTLTPGRGLLRLLLLLGLGALVLNAGQPSLTGLLMPFLHAGATVVPALMAVGLALRGRGVRAVIGAGGEGTVRGGDGTHGTHGTHGTDRTDGALGAEAVVDGGLPFDGPEHTVGSEAWSEFPVSHPSHASHPSHPPQLSSPVIASRPSPALPQPLTVSWQSVAGGMAWGGCAATLLAMVVESVLALGLLLLVVALLGDSAVLGEIMKKLTPEAATAPDPAQQLEVIKTFLDQPLFVVAAFMLMGALAPFTEELAKLLGPLLAQRREDPAGDAAEARQRAWLRGVCAGAGFGAFEAIFYSGMVFSPGSWMIAVALRACTTVMHATFGGVAALGWRLGAAEGRVRVGLGLAAAAVLGHGLWNSLALGAMIASMQAGGSGEGRPVGAVGSALALGLILLFYGLLAMFAGVTRWVNRADRVA